MSVKSAFYDQDFYAWSLEQAALLRAGRADQADLEHIAEEIESMGRTEKRELVARLTILLLHLIKWQFQPAMRTRGWRLSIEGQRLDIDDHLGDNSSLKAVLAPSVAQAYRRAVIEAEKETGFDAASFPAACPYSFEQMMSADFWPA
jgi:hypothetical protein